MLPPSQAHRAIVDSLRSWCGKKSMSTSGVLVLTIHKNRSTQFCSLVVNFATDSIAANYPAELLTSYDEGTAGNGAFNLCYKVSAYTS
jgi:hypothetical protein